MANLFTDQGTNRLIAKANPQSYYNNIEGVCSIFAEVNKFLPIANAI